MEHTELPQITKENAIFLAVTKNIEAFFIKKNVEDQ